MLLMTQSEDNGVSKVKLKARFGPKDLYYWL